MSSLEWKTALLNHVKEKGIWLLDASVHGCYKGKGKRLPPKIVREIVPVSWNKYVRTIIDDISIDEEFVWVIGKGVHDMLNGKYVRGSNWVYQPNVRFPNPKKYEEKRQREIKLEQVIKKRCDIK